MIKENFRYKINELINELEVNYSDVVPLYESYFNEMREEISELLNYLSERDWEMLKRTVHNIKGVSANLRINDVYVAALEYESILKAEAYDKAGMFINSILELVNDAEHDVREFFDDLGYKM